MSLSAAVMAHPSRVGWVTELLHGELSGAPVAWECGSGEWDTARRALSLYRPDASHHLVIQDDAIPAPDLLARVEDALRFVPPATVVGLYLGRVRPRSGTVSRTVSAAERAGAAWITASRLMWGVATVYPVELLDALTAGCDKLAVLEYDRRVSTWLRRRGVRVWYSFPSLVDHRDGPSLLAHDRTDVERRAHRFAGIEPVDWAAGVVELPDRHGQTQFPRKVGRPRISRR